MAYLNSNSFSVLFGEDVSDESGVEIQWKQKRDWKGFLEVGKNEGVTTVIFDKHTLEHKQLEGFSQQVPHYEEIRSKAVGF